MLGIDVSKDKLDYCLVSPTKEVLLGGSVPNNPEGFAELLSKVDPGIAWIIEPTGKYGLGAVNAARSAGRTVLQALTIDANRVLRGLNSRAKTDPLDGRGLALYAMASDKLRPYPIKEMAVDELDQLLSVRRNLSRSIAKFKLQQQTLELVSELIEPIIEGLQNRLNEIDKEIPRRIRATAAFEPALRLQEIPGIGPVTAATVCSRLTAKQFDNPEQFVAYVGLAVGVRQSGKRSSNTGLDKRGDGELRRLLYLAAMSNLSCKASPFKDQYLKYKARGLASTQALCAVARKIARVCWSIHKHGTCYSADRVSEQPNARKGPIEPAGTAT